MPKIYFEDTGLVNILKNKTFLHNIEGNLLESSIYSELRKNLSVEDIYFWRTNKQQEVDFVIDRVIKGKNILSAVEVKNTFLNKYLTNISYFKKEYLETKTYFCCFNKNEAPRNKDIKAVYPWELMLLIAQS